MMPAPTIRSFCGTVSNDKRAGRGYDRSSSISMPGSRAASEPVAMTIFLVSSRWVDPSFAFTSIAPGAAIVPGPKSVDLVLLQQKADAVDISGDRLVLVLHHCGKVELRLARDNAECGKLMRGSPRIYPTPAAAPSRGCSRC